MSQSPLSFIATVVTGSITWIAMVIIAVHFIEKFW